MGEQFVLGEPQGDQSGDGAWTPIPNDTFLEAKVLTINKEKMPFQDRETGADVYKVVWNFQVTEEGPFENRRVKGQTSVNFVKHPECRMFMWVQNLIGADTELPPDFRFNTDDVLGTPCKIHVELTSKPSTKNPGTDFHLNSVKDVLPLRTGTPGNAFASASVSSPAGADEVF